MKFDIVEYGKKLRQFIEEKKWDGAYCFAETILKMLQKKYETLELHHVDCVTIDQSPGNVACYTKRPSDKNMSVIIKAHKYNKVSFDLLWFAGDSTKLDSTNAYIEMSNANFRSGWSKVKYTVSPWRVEIQIPFSVGAYRSITISGRNLAHQAEWKKCLKDLCEHKYKPIPDTSSNSWIYIHDIMHNYSSIPACREPIEWKQQLDDFVEIHTSIIPEIASEMAFIAICIAGRDRGLAKDLIASEENRQSPSSANDETVNTVLIDQKTVSHKQSLEHNIHSLS